jgi:hypothetical protein
MATVSKNKIDSEIEKEISEYMDAFKKSGKSFLCNGMRLVVAVNKVSARSFYIGSFFVKESEAKKGNVVGNIDGNSCVISYVY